MTSTTNDPHDNGITLHTGRGGDAQARIEQLDAVASPLGLLSEMATAEAHDS